MGIADFLFTPAMQRVLGVTLLQPHRTFTLRELLRIAGGGRGSTQKQIDRFVAAGVLHDEARRGNQRSIRANTDFIFYAELLSIACKSFAVVQPLKEALAPFAGKIDSAFVFGSVAKGTDNAMSDIDLIVIGSAPFIELSAALQSVEVKLMRPLNFSLYEPAEWRGLVATDTVVAQVEKGPRLTVI